MKPALAAVLLLLLPAGAQAFVRSSVNENTGEEPFLFWRDRNVPFILNAAGSRDVGAEETLRAARASFAVWTAPACTDLRFQDQGQTNRSDVGFDPDADDNINLVVWRERTCADVLPEDDPCFQTGSCANQGNCWDAQGETIAVTTTTFSQRSGQIVDADIEFNGAGFVFTTLGSGPACPRNVSRPPPDTCIATDIENTLVHEIGHYLGLDHVNDPESTMYRSAVNGETKKRTLAQDDVDGVCFVYPAGALTPGASGNGQTSEPEPQADKSGGCGCSTGGLPALGSGLLPVLWWVSRRRRAPSRRGR